MKASALLAAALVLGGCATPPSPSKPPAERPRPDARGAFGNAGANRPGSGTVELVSHASSPPAVAGGTSVRKDELTVRMDDGSRQTVVLPSGTGIGAGDRVEVTGDSRIMRR